MRFIIGHGEDVDSLLQELCFSVLFLGLFAFNNLLLYVAAALEMRN